MRMQTRPFVVEHKMSRRFERHADKSMWAGLDLAAVAEEVVDDLPAEQDDRQNRQLAAN